MLNEWEIRWTHIKSFWSTPRRIYKICKKSLHHVALTWHICITWRKLLMWNKPTGRGTTIGWMYIPNDTKLLSELRQVCHSTNFTHLLICGDKLDRRDDTSKPKSSTSKHILGVFSRLLLDRQGSNPSRGKIGEALFFTLIMFVIARLERTLNNNSLSHLPDIAWIHIRQMPTLNAERIIVSNRKHSSGIFVIMLST